MKKEEILEKSRQENQNLDLAELEIRYKAQRIGGLCAICVAFVLIIMEWFVLDNGTNYGYFFIIMSASAGVGIYQAIKIKKKREILLAVLWILPAVYAAVMYFSKLAG